MYLGVLPHLLWTGRFIHFLGLALAIGAAAAGAMIFRRGIERGAVDAVGKVEIPGLFIALFGGILLVVANPDVLDPEKSGAGPWLHIKLAFVMAALVIAHLRRFNIDRLLRARDAGEPITEIAPLLSKGKLLDSLGLATYLVILFLATFRVMLFAG